MGKNSRAPYGWDCATNLNPPGFNGSVRPSLRFKPLAEAAPSAIRSYCGKGIQTWGGRTKRPDSLRRLCVHMPTRTMKDLDFPKRSHKGTKSKTEPCVELLGGSSLCTSNLSCNLLWVSSGFWGSFRGAFPPQEKTLKTPWIPPRAPSRRIRPAPQVCQESGQLLAEG